MPPARAGLIAVMWRNALCSKPWLKSFLPVKPSKDPQTTLKADCNLWQFGGCNANMKEHNCWIQLVALMRTCPWGLWQTNSSCFIALCLNFPLSFQLDTAHCWIMPGEGSYLCNCVGREQISGERSTQWKFENTGRVASRLPPLREVLLLGESQPTKAQLWGLSLPLGKPLVHQGL